MSANTHNGGRPGLAQVKAYVGHTWTVLDEAARARMREVLVAIEGVCSAFGFDVVISSRKWPPGEHPDVSTRRLWPEMRSEMGTCNLMIAIVYGPSAGLVRELWSAKDFTVPVIFMLGPGTRFTGTIGSAAHRKMGLIQFEDSLDAQERLRQFVDEHLTDIQRDAFRIKLNRRESGAYSVLGSAIRSERERRGMTTSELADRVALTDVEITAMETDIVGLNPPFEHLVAVARGLDTTLIDLLEAPPERWERELEFEVYRAALEWSWRLPWVRQYLRFRRERPGLPELPMRRDVRDDMMHWLEHSGLANESPR